MSASKATILLTAGGGAMVPLAIRQMHDSRRHQIRVVAVNTQAGVAAEAMADAFHVVPYGTDPGYVDAVLDIVRRDGVTLVMPWSDEEALALAPHADRFAALGAVLACTTPENLAIMSDKAATFRRLGDVGIPVPDWRHAETDAQLLAALDDLMAVHGAAVVKPERSRGGRNVYVVRPDADTVMDVDEGRECHLSPAAFLALGEEGRRALLPAMVMERLVPPAYDIDILCRRGQVLRCVPRRRINPAGIPFRGGVIENLPELHALAADIARVLNLDWLYDIDVFTTRDGAWRVIETNPRPSGSLPATIAAGIDLFDDLVSLAQGKTLPPLTLPDQRLVLPFTAAIASDDAALLKWHTP